MVFAVILVVVAVLTKIIGCGLGAKMCHYSNQDCIRIGMGMISRGEVALIVAAKGNAIGLMAPDLLGPVGIVVVITTIISPILLKLTFREKKGEAEGTDFVETELIRQVQGFEEEEQQEKSRYVKK